MTDPQLVWVGQEAPIELYRNAQAREGVWQMMRERAAQEASTHGDMTMPPYCLSTWFYTVTEDYSVIPAGPETADCVAMRMTVRATPKEVER